MSILNIFEKQRMTWHAFPGFCSLPIGYDLLKLLNSNSVSAHFDECAHNGSHHVAQKTISRYSEVPAMRGRAYPFGFGYMAKGGFYIGVAFAKSCKIVSQQ